jgi:lysophospholipase L1-like esterase
VIKHLVYLGLILCCAFSKQSYKGPVRILFVGNSLTYTNNLPQLVTQVASNNDFNVKTEMLAYANYALEDHWNDGELQKLIASGRFDYVVIQQGPSSQADGKAMLLDYGERIKSLCTRHKVQLAFYMVWPARVNYKMFEGVITNYTLAAAKTNSILCPVGQLWKNHFDVTQDFSYYGPDGFHPSLAGSQRAAEVIFESLKLQQ